MHGLGRSQQVGHQPLMHIDNANGLYDQFMEFIKDGSGTICLIVLLISTARDRHEID